MDLPSRSAHPRPTVFLRATRLHRRPRVQSTPSVLQVPESRCQTSLESGRICSRGRPGIPSRTSDLVTMNARQARSDSFLTSVLCARLSPWVGLAFLDPVLHNASHNRRRNHTHPEGRRDRPIEAPATTRISGQVLSPTARSWEMRLVVPATTRRRADTPHLPRRRWGFLLPRIATV